MTKYEVPLLPFYSSYWVEISPRSYFIIRFLYDQNLPDIAQPWLLLLPKEWVSKAWDGVKKNLFHHCVEHPKMKYPANFHKNWTSQISKNVNFVFLVPNCAQPLHLKNPWKKRNSDNPRRLGVKSSNLDQTLSAWRALCGCKMKSLYQVQQGASPKIPKKWPKNGQYWVFYKTACSFDFRFSPYA